MGDMLSLGHAPVQQAEHRQVAARRARNLAQQAACHLAHQVVPGIQQALQHQILDPCKFS